MRALSLSLSLLRARALFHAREPTVQFHGSVNHRARLSFFLCTPHTCCCCLFSSWTVTPQWSYSFGQRDIARFSFNPHIYVGFSTSSRKTMRNASDQTIGL